MMCESLIERFKLQSPRLSLVRWGCFSCMRTMTTAEIRLWVDGGDTPVCTHCGVDAVLPGIESEETLAALHKRAFSVDKAKQAKH